jgi:hypothetical protein
MLRLKLRSDNFWSSTGDASSEASEHLTYVLDSPLCIITHVSILPYKARYQRGMPVYAPKFLSISCGFKQSGEPFHYQSNRPYPVRNQDCWQTFPVTPTLVIGNFVRLNLLGKYQTQPGNDLFYTVLQQVKIFGIHVGMLESLHKPVLTRTMVSWAHDILRSGQSSFWTFRSNCVIRIPDKDNEDNGEASRELIIKELTREVEQEVANAASLKLQLTRLKKAVMDGKWDEAMDMMDVSGVSWTLFLSRSCSCALRLMENSPQVRDFETPKRCRGFRILNS